MKADAVVALIVDDGVLLAFGRKKVGVITFTTFKCIIACFAVEGVIACFAEKMVIAFAAINKIVTAAAVNDVVTATAVEAVAAFIADEDVVTVVACAKNVGCTGQNKVFNVVWKGIADVAVNRIISAIWVFNDCIVAAGYMINVISRRACCCLCKGGTAAIALNVVIQIAHCGCALLFRLS